MRLLDEMAERKMRGKEGNALFMGPKNRVSEMTHALQKLTRGGSFGKRDRYSRSTNSFVTHCKKKKKMEI